MTIDLDRLKQKRAALESKLAEATATLRESERRLDSRMKIVAGATLLAAVRDGAIPVSVLPTLVARMSDRDRLLFADMALIPARELEEPRT